ncbi:MAG: YebC/PmpR family DNA-binding transcriptional regulator [Erysipelotrichales bacterium]|nr:YebC/PmpR family DNA-binding transcriptional regulator [Erysipelotrichales bacterium]
MGRAYEVRKASIQKTGAAKAKLYSTFAKEIYLAAKGNPEVDTNINLKRVVEKAKHQQVPSDIINRAIDKAKGASGDDYQELSYEGFGPGQSTLIVKCLTDNVNRTVSFVREAFNKCHKSLGVTNSVSYNYDYLAIIGFKSDNGDDIMMSLLDEGIEIVDLESDDGEVVITAKPGDASSVKDVVERMIPDVVYTLDEIGWYAKEKCTLEGEDLEVFERLLSLLDAIDDVTEVYHNVNLGE